jgi:hypothetical protein
VVQKACPFVFPFGAVYSRSHASGIGGSFFLPSTAFDAGSSDSVTSPRSRIVAVVSSRFAMP